MTNHPPLKAHPSIQGRCPACRSDSLFIGSGGYVTCSRLDCPNPSAADQLLHGEPAAPANNAGQSPRTTSDNSPTSSDTEADLSRVIALYERWVKAGAPPLGVSINRWWDRRLIELRHAIVAEPASDGGPSVAECVKADRAWDVEKGGE